MSFGLVGGRPAPQVERPLPFAACVVKLARSLQQREARRIASAAVVEGLRGALGIFPGRGEELGAALTGRRCPTSIGFAVEVPGQNIESGFGFVDAAEGCQAFRQKPTALRHCASSSREYPATRKRTYGSARRKLRRLGHAGRFPEHERALRIAVDDLLASGRSEEALGLAAAASERVKKSAAAHDVLARVLYHDRRLAEAKAEFERATVLDPTYAPAWQGLATIAAAEDDVATAVTLFDRAAQLRPSDPEPAYRAAQLQLAAKRTEDAERRLREIVRRAPTHAQACNDLAWLLAQDGKDLDLAERLARRAVRLHESAETADTLAVVQAQRARAASGGGDS